jgi:hypothetical protein
MAARLALLLLVASIVFFVIAARLATVHAPPISDVRHQEFIAWKTHRLVTPIFTASAVLAGCAVGTFLLHMVGSIKQADKALMRFRLRTLMIVLALGPPMLAVVWLYPLELTLIVVTILLFSAFVTAALHGIAVLCPVLDSIAAAASHIFRSR